MSFLTGVAGGDESIVDDSANAASRFTAALVDMMLVLGLLP